MDATHACWIRVYGGHAKYIWGYMAVMHNRAKRLELHLRVRWGEGSQIRGKIPRKIRDADRINIFEKP